MYKVASRGRIILASGSARRVSFFKLLGVPFEVSVSSISEIRQQGETAEDYVQRVSLEKAMAVCGSAEPKIIIGADTDVVLDGEVLGKPRDLCDARSILTRLAGRWHDAFSGFCIIDGLTGKPLSRQLTQVGVKFRTLSKEEVESYVLISQPLDKAGAYGLQDEGFFLIEEIRGSYSAVMGLDMAKVISELLRLKIVLPQ